MADERHAGLRRMTPVGQGHHMAGCSMPFAAQAAFTVL
ncbi:MAG: hypothetical protein RJA94_837 [Pseudomonadota bacterium]|jgi:hypothetical protein